MNLSQCLHCGGHIPLGPSTSNCCTTCGKSVMSGPTPAPTPLDTINYLVAENLRLSQDNALLGARIRQLEAELRTHERAFAINDKMSRVRDILRSSGG